ncbi:putative type VI secretion system effector [Xanthomonas oryzae]|uniref:putative type VI secretion system effector n=1 Tax=Xanthomonas oryzae TaxID=347 RepID=UPI001F5E573D|nr:putative type VI secretion system effector [Xanthomonas oryzae]
MNDIDLSKSEVLTGRLENYHVERATADFLLREEDRQAVGLTAIGAALAGSGGAVGLASMADIKEEATKVTFEMGGRKFSGWLMWSPFKQGDEVSVVAEKLGNGEYNALAILRPVDRTIALYPHCSRGGRAHFRKAASISLKFYLFIYVVGNAIFYGDYFINGAKYDWKAFLVFSLGSGCGAFLILGVIAWNVSRKFIPFTRMAEAIFTVLGWKDVKNIDLPARSRAERKASGTPGLGKLYFRY